jgi:hypothetical protein
VSNGVKARESTKVGYDEESRRIAIDGRGVPHFSGCPYRLCHPEVLVVKAAQDGQGYDAPERLHRSAERCVFAEG